MTREDAVLNLLANGELRLAEAARALGWSRSKMSRHGRAAGIDARGARRELVKALVSEIGAAATSGRRRARTISNN